MVHGLGMLLMGSGCFLTFRVPVSWSLSTLGLRADPTVEGLLRPARTIGLGRGELPWGGSPADPERSLGWFVLPPVTLLVLREDESVVEGREIPDGDPIRPLIPSVIL